MSPESREQTQVLLDDLWTVLLGEIGQSRHLEPKAIQATVDSEGIIGPRPPRSGLVDKIGYATSSSTSCGRKLLVCLGMRRSRQVTLAHYAKTVESEGAPSGPAKSPSCTRRGSLLIRKEADQIGGLRFARELRRLREDSSIRAIVLRVNSPGGSASAAEDIQREVRLAQEVKPVVISMGSYAASEAIGSLRAPTGSSRNRRRSPDPSVSASSSTSKARKHRRITFDNVKTGHFAGALTIARPKTDEEIAIVQKGVDWIYAQFVSKVAEGRKLKPEFVGDRPG